jgi:hypothetical protein
MDTEASTGSRPSSASCAWVDSTSACSSMAGCSTPSASGDIDSTADSCAGVSSVLPTSERSTTGPDIAGAANAATARSTSAAVTVTGWT